MPQLFVPVVEVLTAVGSHASVRRPPPFLPRRYLPWHLQWIPRRPCARPARLRLRRETAGPDARQQQCSGPCSRRPWHALACRRHLPKARRPAQWTMRRPAGQRDGPHTWQGSVSHAGFRLPCRRRMHRRLLANQRSGRASTANARRPPRTCSRTPLAACARQRKNRGRRALTARRQQGRRICLRTR